MVTASLIATLLHSTWLDMDGKHLFILTERNHAYEFDVGLSIQPMLRMLDRDASACKDEFNPRAPSGQDVQ